MSALVFMVFISFPNKLTPQVIQFQHFLISWTFLMTYSRAKLKSSGINNPLWAGKESDDIYLQELYLTHHQYNFTLTLFNEILVDICGIVS
jgi:hypothetical protein